MADETSSSSAVSSSSASPADCRFGIELTREISTYDVTGRPQAWRMKITVTETYNCTPNIFIFMRKEAQMEGQPATDTFEAVASPVDIDEYPVGEPTPGVSPAFYRLASIDVLSRNRGLLDEAWEAIKQDCDELVLTLANICETQVDEVSRSGYFPSEEPVTPSEGSTTPESSSGPATCPVDPVAGIEITASDDPDFPVAAVLAPSGGVADPPECTRTWLLTGGVSGSVLKLETSLTSHSFVAYLDDVEVDSGGLADGYVALINYDKPGEGERNLSISAV